MKLAGRQANGFCRKPDLEMVGALIHGNDPGQTLEARRQLIGAILGDPPDVLRITRLDPADARRDGALILDSLKTQGFFPGRRVVLLEGATDGAAKSIGAALKEATTQDAFFIATAGSLPGKSALRKLFESGRHVTALQLFADALDVADVPGALRERGFRGEVTEDAAARIAEAAQTMDHGSAQQMLELIALYALTTEVPLDAAGVERIIPRGLGADADAFVSAVASGAPERLGPLLLRLAAEGVQPVTIVLAMQRHFRQLLQASCASGGPSAGLASLRPPVWGRQRDEMAAQLQRWSRARLEQACRVLFETDRQLRSANPKPGMAVLERASLRLAIMGRG